MSKKGTLVSSKSTQTTGYIFACASCTQSYSKQKRLHESEVSNPHHALSCYFQPNFYICHFRFSSMLRSSRGVRIIIFQSLSRSLTITPRNLLKSGSDTPPCGIQPAVKSLVMSDQVHSRTLVMTPPPSWYSGQRASPHTVFSSYDHVTNLLETMVHSC